MRIGIGYDIHRIEAGRRLVLGGVTIPSDMGLGGHSDADVIVHAVMDALLGAAGEADIGTHFPPSDERYRDASSLDLLARVRELVRGAGFDVVSVDAVLVAERPRIGPFVRAMKERMAERLGIATDAIGIKATTNEGLGPEGRGEAMSAQAVALLQESS